MKDKIKKELRGRFFFFSSDEKHLKEETIIKALTHKSIYRYAYVLHNKDKYTLADLTNQQTKIEKYKAQGKEYKGKIITENDIGKPKPNHFHIALDCHFTPLAISTIASWFGLEENMIDIAKGRDLQNPFIDCCRYLTHEETKQQELGKQLYDYTEIQHSKNFDFENEMKKINEIKDLFGETISKEQAYFRMVSEGLKTPNDIYLMDEDFYNNNLKKIKELRNDYISNRATLPLARINYYVEGQSGIGKSELVEALARSLNPCADDKDCFFYAKKGKFPFDNYNGQKVIIWDDFSPQDILESCKGMTGFYNIFDKPKNQTQDIKNSHIRLLNQFNIITHTTEYKTYLDALNGKYTYTKQVFNKDTKKFEAIEVETEIKSNGSYRRFPIILKVNVSDFDIYLSNGWLNDNMDFDNYTIYQNVRGSMKYIAERCAGNIPLRNQIQNKVVEPIKKITTTFYEKRTKTNQSEEEIKAILEDTKDFGKTQGELIKEGKIKSVCNELDNKSENTTNKTTLHT